MRYNDWDVLLFPAGQASRYAKTPFKEFGVGCQVIPDVEQAHCQASVGLPIVTCCVPSIQPGAPFQVSVHSWSEPEITQFTKSYSKHVDLVQFEARVFIDGQLVSSSVFNRKNKEWPHIIDTTLELSKSGELELLKFPAFKKEPLDQSYWNPGDDTGRIKVVISEGFPRDSLTMPVERVKNVVAFSFQHAPLDVLEAKGIAWPNPSMWRAPTLANFSQSASLHTDDGLQSHAHSPRRQPRAIAGFQGFGSSSTRRAIQPNTSAFTSNLAIPPGLHAVPGAAVSGIGMPSDSFNDMAYYNDLIMSAPFSSGFGSKTMWPASGLTGHGMSGNLSGILQTDYLARDNTCAPFDGEPMHISGPSLEDDESIPTPTEHAKVPTNTPTAGSALGSYGTTISAPFQPNADINSFVTPDFAHSLTHCLLNQPLPVQPQNIPLPASEIKSRKEQDARFPTINGSDPGSALLMPQEVHPDVRKFSLSRFNPGPGIFGHARASGSPASAALTSAITSRNPSNTDFGSNTPAIGAVGTPVPLGSSSAASLNADINRKRNRNFTPASAKAIDDEDQPLRPSPHLRGAYSMADDESD